VLNIGSISDGSNTHQLLSRNFNKEAGSDGASLCRKALMILNRNAKGIAESACEGFHAARFDFGFCPRSGNSSRPAGSPANRHSCRTPPGMSAGIRTETRKQAISHFKFVAMLILSALAASERSCVEHPIAVPMRIACRFWRMLGEGVHEIVAVSAGCG